MGRFFRSKLFISFILLILVGVLVFVALPKLYSKQAETVEVIKFTADVNLGTRITDSMLATEVRGAYNLEPGVITMKKDIVGKYAARKIDAREYLYADMFTDTYEEVDGIAATLIEPGQKLFTLTTGTLSKSVAGQIKPGSKVNIYTQVFKEPEYDEFGYEIEQSDELEMELLPELTGIYVFKTQNGAGEDIAMLNRKWQAEIDNGADEADIQHSSLIPSVVTLIVTDEQAELLAKQEYVGTIHMTLYPTNVAEEPVDKKPEETEPAQQEAPTAQTEGEPEQSMPETENEASAAVGTTEQPQQGGSTARTQLPPQ